MTCSYDEAWHAIYPDGDNTYPFKGAIWKHTGCSRHFCRAQLAHKSDLTSQPGSTPWLLYRTCPFFSCFLKNHKLLKAMGASFIICSALRCARASIY